MKHLLATTALIMALGLPAHAADPITNDTTATETDSASSHEGMVQSGAVAPVEGYVMVEPTALAVEEIEGARVYDANNEWIGEISKIIVEGDGAIKSLVVDVGGFLGIGEKPVAIDFEAFQMQQSVDGSDLRVHVSASKEQLESMPDYES